MAARLYIGIAEYEAEIIEFLKAGYLGTVTYGFRRDGNWIEPTLRYTARDLAGGAANDDDPGRVRPGANTIGATFYSYLTYSSSWSVRRRTMWKSSRDACRSGEAARLNRASADI